MENIGQIGEGLLCGASPHRQPSARSGHTRTAGKFPVTGHLTWRVLDARADLPRRVTHPSAQSETPPERGLCWRENGYCLRREKPRPARPRPSSASVAGSGTDEVLWNRVVKPRDVPTPAK